MTMTADETIDLLSLIATYDQRTIGTADVEAWLIIATEEGWTFPLARRAVIQHHRRGADRGRIRPAHITDTLDQLRETVRRTVLRTDLVPPAELADDPRAEIAWRRGYTDSVKQQALDAWASGRELLRIEPAPPAPRMPPPKAVNDLVGESFALRAPRREEPADPNHRALKIAEARAELEQIRGRAEPPDDEAAP